MTGGQPKPRRGPFSVSVALSVVLHALVFCALVLFVRPAPRLDQKRGEPLLVERANLAPPAPKGNPAERSKHAAPTPDAAGAIPPAPAGPPPGAPEVERPAIKEMPAPAPRVASVPRAETPPVPPAKERGAPGPRPEPRMAPPGPPLPAGEPAAAGDRLAALRPHPPGGGLVGGRGGIEGEPIPLDTKDPKFGDYFERLRRAIQEKWLYPREAAEKNIGGQLVLEFGIA